MYEEYRLSPDGHVVMAVFDRAKTMDLGPSDRTVAAILVGLGQVMTDEQLEETYRLLDQAAVGVDSFPYNFLKFAQSLVTERQSERFEAMLAAEIAIFGEPAEWDEVPTND